MERDVKRVISTSGAIGSCLCAGLFVAGSLLGVYIAKPYSISVKDVDKDGKGDVVVEDIRGIESIFLNRGNECYTELNQYEQQQKRKLESEFDEIRKDLYNSEVKVYNEGEKEQSTRQEAELTEIGAALRYLGVKE